MTSPIIISPSISESSDAWVGKCPHSKTSELKSGRQGEVLESQVMNVRSNKGTIHKLESVESRTKRFDLLRQFFEILGISRTEIICV